MNLLRESGNVAFRNARVIDPYCEVDHVGDLSIADGILVDKPAANTIDVDATGWIICPGLMDIHVHLREPGQTKKESIATGSAAAAAGGFTFVACMPNTSPPLDNPDQIRNVMMESRKHNLCTVGPIGTITTARAGNELADMQSMKEAGAVAFSDDGTGVEKDDVMRAAFQKAAEINAVLIQHCEYAELSAGGVMHLGDVSRKLDMPGLDPRSEEAMIERDLDLCRSTGGRYHVAHISTAHAIELVRAAKAEGLPVTTEVCPHHLALTDEACLGKDPNTKMHPPLRPLIDLEACRQGLLDGTIDCIATDHAPHTAEEKAAGFLKAPPGIVGLETAFSLAADVLVRPGLADWARLVAWFTAKASTVLDMPPRPLNAGRKVDLTIIQPEQEWTVEPENFLSKSRNTPFGGRNVPARILATVRGRNICSRDPALLA